jgi:multidrug transporter EmrE-like cation transporter
VTKRGLWLVLLTAGLTVIANLLLRSGVVRAGNLGGTLADLPSALLRLASQPLFVIGFIAYGTASLVWFQVIATEPLSTAYPLLVSLTFLLVTLSAAILFQEAVSFRKLLGLGIVLIGIFIISSR